jgi:dihydroorotate dehydrogenase electron transfer subunit
MPKQFVATIRDHRSATPQLRWLTVDAPDLARDVRPGQYILVRCTEPGGHERLLRRALFVAAAEPALGQLAMLYAPSEPGLAWLARQPQGAELDLIAPLGAPLPLHPRTRSALLMGSGPALAALVLLARQAHARGAEVTLLAAADDQDALPPSFLLPPAIEYHGIVGSFADLLAQTQTVRSPGNPVSQFLWADQLFAVISPADLSGLRNAVHAAKYRWERGFAHALLDGPLICGIGSCGVCAVRLRRGTAWLCSDGPVFDLRDLPDG